MKPSQKDINAAIGYQVTITTRLDVVIEGYLVGVENFSFNPYLLKIELKKDDVQEIYINDIWKFEMKK